MIDYSKLLKLLEDNGYTPQRIRKEGILSQSTYYHLRNRKGFIRDDVIDKMCALFNCQPNDIMEWIPDKEEETL